MAQRPLDKQNWQRRKSTTYSPYFRIDTGNPQMGLSGTSVYDLYAVTDNRDVSNVGMTFGGLYHIYNDQCIEIVGGQKSSSTGVDIIITGKNGDVWITAEKNGQVRIRGANIVIDADENLTLKAGNNIEIRAGNKIDLKSNIANCDALDGNLPPPETTLGGITFAETFVDKELIASSFSGGSPDVAPPAPSPADDDLLSDENTTLTGNETSGSFAPGGAASGGALAE